MLVVKAFEEQLQRQNAMATITEVGCMGLCYAEPLVVITKPDEFSVCYGNVTPEMVPRLVQGYILDDDPCLEFALGNIRDRDGEAPIIPELSRFEIQRRLVLRNCGYIAPEDINHYIAGVDIPAWTRH